MSTTFSNPNFKSRLTDNITSRISKLTDSYFEHYNNFSNWAERKQDLDYQYREYTNASAIRKTGWFFLLFVLLPVIGVFDYSSVSAFLSYLVASSGGVLGSMISIIGWIFFLLLELAIGWLILYSKDKPALRFMAITLAVCMTLLPSYLIYTTYSINPQKTALLFNKTMALIIVSVLLHALLFFVIAEVWAGINYVVYMIKNRLLASKDPQRNMKQVKNQLQELYPDFDRYVLRNATEEIATLLHNRAWFLKGKLQNGNTNDDYDLSDYNPEVSYAPQVQAPSSTNGTYHYTVK